MGRANPAGDNSASVTINLDQDYDLIADKLTLNGQIITNGHKLNLFVH